MTAAVRERAPAKVNLYLHVTGRRDDGMHLLDGLVVFAATGDSVAVEPADDLALAVTGPFADAVPAGPDNLVLRAARALADAAGVTAGAAITLEKHLPVAAGIGGGSADAAAALRALARLWALDLPEDRLHALAADLGADVPVCLAGRPAWLGGMGEMVADAPALPPLHLALANPGAPLTTPAVFKARTGGFSAPARWTDGVADVPALTARLAARRNDLTAPAAHLLPAIDTALDAMAAQPGCHLARLSGSGPTVFGLFDDAERAQAAAEALRAAHPGWWTAGSAVPA